MNYFKKAEMMLSYSLTATAICCFLVLLYCIFYGKGKRIRIEDLFISLLVVVISSLRYGVGSDYFRYMESANIWARRFVNVRSLFTRQVLNQYSFEVGYKALSVIADKLFDSQYAIFWIVSIILYIPIVWYCRKKTSSARAAFATFILFGFWGMSLNVMQQAIAMAFVLFSYDALKEKKYIEFGLLAIIAETFHTTAIVAILIIVIVNFGVLKKLWEPNKRNLMVIIGVGIVLRMGTNYFIKIASRIGYFAKYLRYLNAGAMDSISRKYIMYGALIETIIVIVILYKAILKLDSLKDNNPSISKVISIIMLGIPFSIIGISKTLWLANRFAKFFFLFLIILIPDLLVDVDTQNDRSRHLVIKSNQLFFWFSMVAWHVVYSLLMLDNNSFQISTYLFQ